MFPTAYRGTVFGMSNVFGKVGGIFAPLVDGIAKDSFLYIFGTLGILSGLLSLLLGETKGKVMTDNLN